MDNSSIKHPATCCTALRRNLAAIIAIKILFLVIFWHLVLKYQAVHVSTPMMSDRLLEAHHSHP